MCDHSHQTMLTLLLILIIPFASMVESFRSSWPVQITHLFSKNHGSRSKLTSSEKEQVDAKQDAVVIPISKFCKCPKCNRAYFVDHKGWRNPGERVRCSVCKGEWFMPLVKLSDINENNILISVSDEDTSQSKDLYVTNVPYEYTSDDLGALFQDYGVAGAFVVLDKEKQSKGFGFVEIADGREADRAIKEMNGFYCDGGRPLKVSLASSQKK